MPEMKSLTLNDKTYDSFVDGVARPLAEASAITCSASGINIVVSDSSYNALAGLNIYGKSIQNGAPTPSAPVDIISVGDDGNIVVGVKDNTNILTTTFSSGSIDKETGTDTSDPTIQRTGYLTSGGNTTYVVNGMGGPLRAFFYDANKVLLSTIFLEQGDWFTTPATCAYVRFQVSVAGYSTAISVNKVDAVDISNIVLRGIQVTDKALATYTDASGKMWCADEIDLAAGVYRQNVYAKVFTGAESFTKMTANGGNYYALNSSTNPANNTDDKLTGALCNYLTEKVPGVLWSTPGDGFAVSTVQQPIRLRIESLASIDALKAQLAEWYANGEPMVMVFRLATPVETPLSDAEIAAYKDMRTGKPSTTITNSENAYMSVKYIADTKAYIDSKISSAILAATVE